ncbi:alkaline phosphatase-like protein [Polychaeton citri CBS 116435]|uniref:Alkaline phosphatase n=1 Tax=Polychaeton citri CBS 116435 TaxID=1314669 RepID=A0A9P4QEN5_9PEZI|nr:alkaline phosphatase-like protein [Polychaeton citri CBS 116435]
MVSDGMGPTSLSLTRSWRQYVEQVPYDETLTLDRHMIGQSRTRSSSSLVTDSAAGATAFSCGQKSYNGAISVTPDFEPCGSVMEAAHRLGYTTGLVVTTRLTDATPAVFASHVRRREMEDQIATQMLGLDNPVGRVVDLMFGGGRCHFLPNSTDGSCRADDVNTIAEGAAAEDWKHISTRREFDSLGTSIEMPMVGLFAEGDIPYEIDRQYQEDVFPSLSQMAEKALNALAAATEDKDQGFFIMIEGSRIDHAGHGNDPAAQVHEVREYDRTVAMVLDFIQESSTPTLMVSTSDHETGGLAVARQLHPSYPDYLWYPGVLANASHSASHTSHTYNDHLNGETSPGSKEELKAWLSDLSHQSLGIKDAADEELDLLIEHPAAASYFFAEMISRRAQTGWSTHGHSAADVNIYSSDPKLASDLVGNHENTDVGAFLRSFLELDDEVESVTKVLKEHMKVSAAGEGGKEVSWLGEIPDEGERLDGQDHLDHYDHIDDYAGEHRTRREAVWHLH